MLKFKKNIDSLLAQGNAMFIYTSFYIIAWEPSCDWNFSKVNPLSLELLNQTKNSGSTDIPNTNLRQIGQGSHKVRSSRGYFFV